MKLEEIHDLWSADAKIDSNQLDLESLSIPKLHSKYLRILTDERVKYNALREKRKTTIQKLDDYFNGVIDGKDINRPAWQLTRETKAAIEKRIENDAEIIDLNLKILLQEEKVLILKEIITTITNRSFQISNAINWRRFTGGEL